MRRGVDHGLTFVTEFCSLIAAIFFLKKRKLTWVAVSYMQSMGGRGAMEVKQPRLGVTGAGRGGEVMSAAWRRWRAIEAHGRGGGATEVHDGNGGAEHAGGRCGSGGQGRSGQQEGKGAQQRPHVTCGHHRVNMRTWLAMCWA